LAAVSSGNHAKQNDRWGEKKSENSRRETGLPKERSYPRLGAFLPAQKMTVNKKPNGFLEQIVLWHFRSARSAENRSTAMDPHHCIVATCCTRCTHFTSLQGCKGMVQTCNDAMTNCVHEVPLLDGTTTRHLHLSAHLGVKSCRMNLNHPEKQAWQPLATNGLGCPGFESPFGLEVIRMWDNRGQQRTCGNRWRLLAAIDRNADHTRGGDLNRILGQELAKEEVEVNGPGTFKQAKFRVSGTCETRGDPSTES
jgi:hypothetical protein